MADGNQGEFVRQLENELAGNLEVLPEVVGNQGNQLNFSGDV